MNENFIAKLQTQNYLIGSFDAYFDLSKELMKNNYNISDEEAEEILKGLPTTYRAAITDKNGVYIGYIGLYNVDAQYSTASVRFDVNKDLGEEVEEIINEFKKYASESLNITQIEEIVSSTPQDIKEEKIVLSPKVNIRTENKFLTQGVMETDLERFSEYYSIPKLHMPYSIKSSDRTIGIIGLTNLIWSNRRANLNVFWDKELDDDITSELSASIIDDYLNIVHNLNVHNVTLSVPSSDKNLVNILTGTMMGYYGQIPYSVINDDKLESNLMFQHIPYMQRESGLYIPETPTIALSSLDIQKKDMSKRIELGNGFKLISPGFFEEENVDFDSVLKGHIKAMQEREKFTIPLGEDKYFLQKGNERYGITKALSNYSYVVLDDKNDYAGYINILRTNADGKNVEIEFGIDPRIQHNGLGTMVVNRFYDELFSIGVASVTSNVFAFNNPSLRLHEKVAELRGLRVESYYINGRLWDMSIYSKTNELIEQAGHSK